MNILMCTNTYPPHVGGVARSVASFTRSLRGLGHRVVVIAPEFANQQPEDDVVRVRAIQRFNGSDFSLTLPVPALAEALPSGFTPDLIHTHHPFLLGDSALRLSALFSVPIVFSHHTMYERYTHYVPGDSPALKHFVVELSTGYANLCDHVIAPSESIRSVLRQRGVTAPLSVLPTGIDTKHFKEGDGGKIRHGLGIPSSARLLGHVGRLAVEKNLSFLAHAAARFMRSDPLAHFLLVGEGPYLETMRSIFKEYGVETRVHAPGVHEGQQLVDSYHAMDLFLFSSKTETQGMVVAEAMAAGVPVLAVDAAGVREVVQDGVNGFLLLREDLPQFADKIGAFFSLSPESRERLSKGARAAAVQLSLPGATARLMQLYRTLAGSGRTKHDIENSLWYSTLNLFSVEWQLWSNRAGAVGAAIAYQGSWPLRLLRRVRRRYISLRNRLSRTAWLMRILNLPLNEELTARSGLILIQIDGLSRSQFESTLRRGRMPFLARLFRRDRYRIHTLYSGVPSSTPSVQGELFYGVTQAVPAFGYLDRETLEIMKMYQTQAAQSIEHKLAAQGEALLEGGGSYSNIYRGGAADARFCSAAYGMGLALSDLAPHEHLIFLLWHLPSILRIACLSLIETAVAIGAAVKGIFYSLEFRRELSFIPARVVVSAVLRELIVVWASLGVRRGLPIIHANFLGYDEQSHRRGPSSAFAHWSLRGIDYAIERIANAAAHSPLRPYELWVYSDHGQSHCLSYLRLHGVSLSEAVSDLIKKHSGNPQPLTVRESSVRTERARWLFPEGAHKSPRKEKASGVVVVALGPLAHLYFPPGFNGLSPEWLAEALVKEKGVPLVLNPREDGGVDAFTPRGRFHLPADAAEVLGRDHPFLENAAQDLTALAHHPHSGDLVLSGFRRDNLPLTFPEETGSHAGPGIEEVRAFALLPRKAPISHRHGYLRPGDLRDAALRYLDRLPASPMSKPRGERVIRVMTYNVHSCFGTDGVLSAERVARVISHYSPDVIALQEIDSGCARSHHAEQSSFIAHYLKMHQHFHPALQRGGERYGDAILSTGPMKLRRAGPLPGDPARRSAEPRGALWVALSSHGSSVQVFNTHFGLGYGERKYQIDALFREWFAGLDPQEPSIICGDLNALPGSYVHRTLSRRYQDVQRIGPASKPKATFSSSLPLSRIDHIFVSRHFEVLDIMVPRTKLTSLASDHLPLIADLRLKDGVHG